ncbi:MAG: type II toxin-antitoxin system VapC family toxin [Bifidobacteriaceae bacterium]|nr:type II toxin-antitoxin system VapC family toxin [Bifidobacteriaceae bacterium]
MAAVTVLDSSAVLAFLWGEPGADEVRQALAGGPAVCTVVNWAEVLAKIVRAGADPNAAANVLTALGLRIEPVTKDDAEAAATLWVAHQHLSLGDRFCLATGMRFGGAVLTADRACSSVLPTVHLIR